MINSEFPLPPSKDESTSGNEPVATHYSQVAGEFDAVFEALPFYDSDIYDQTPLDPEVEADCLSRVTDGVLSPAEATVRTVCGGDFDEACLGRALSDIADRKVRLKGETDSERIARVSQDLLLEGYNYFSAHVQYDEQGLPVEFPDDSHEYYEPEIGTYLG
ncbi:hypothetical protein KBD20_04320 [Candidatus Saccharibacteria bacterium]|jgi:hypothetical protein|nr:hypothetical protein [Candidatus Saccharibacteria bacterium]